MDNTSTISSNVTIEQRVINRVNSITNYLALNAYYIADACVRAGINSLYSSNVPSSDNSKFIPDFVEIPKWVWNNKREEALKVCENCYRKQLTKVSQDTGNWTTGPELGPPTDIDTLAEQTPFDQRLYRMMVSKDKFALLQKPFSVAQSDSGTWGYVVATEDNNKLTKEQKQAAENQLKSMKKDPMYQGVPALMNTYALIKLYGSDGGNYLINQKYQRKWYEVNTDPDGLALIPTTTNIINWGNQDPYGRTPYHFSDFILCKYWKRIPNNRMITLRRYPAPVLDNLKFEGMDGDTKAGQDSTPKSNGDKATNSDNSNSNAGSSKQIMFAPMATAITYFGEGTENSLSSILKFTTGVLWDDVQANVWNIEVGQSPGAESGAGGLNPGLTKFAQMLGIASGKADTNAIMNKGNPPPDPYTNGPYENRIQGPVNRIDSVKKRKAGLDFKMTGLQLKFHYVARPVGGINPKAVLLDVLSNFLIIGSASAVFWGGAHRFMGAPASYPFIGGDAGAKDWYSGNVTSWAGKALTSFADQGKAAGGNFIESVKNMFGSLLGGSSQGGSSNLGDFLTKGLVGNAIKTYAASKSEGQIPYLRGLRALLIGEPVGEWHLTIGNPLNPIALIGNLICTGIEVEFGNELGPDDFPTEIKITVNLDHGMARDRDGIESMFNRGMGRIYDIPDNFVGTADQQTYVDKATKNRTGGNLNLSVSWNYPIANSKTNMGATSNGTIRPPATSGSVSVWNTFNVKSISGDETVINENTYVTRSRFARLDWIARKALM